MTDYKHEECEPDSRHMLIIDFVRDNWLASTADFLEMFDCSYASFQKHLGLAREHLRANGIPAVIQTPAKNGGPYLWVSNAASVEVGDGGRATRDKNIRGRARNMAIDLKAESELAGDRHKALQLAVRAKAYEFAAELEDLVVDHDMVSISTARLTRSA